MASKRREEGRPDSQSKEHASLKEMPTVLLLDANHLMHRAYWAIQRNLSTSSGEQTNAVFGVASMMLTMLKREHPEALVACFDEGSETFRHQEHEEYKAGRAETPDDFYDQIARVKQCFTAFGVPVISDPKFEADDLLGTLAVRGAHEGFKSIVVSGDRDLLQLPNGHVTVAIPHKGYSEPEYLDAEGVKHKLGVPPERVPDLKGLTGDASDNLKGVKGIGPKTAAKLLQEYGTLDELYCHLDKVSAGIRTKLEADRESAFFCRDMATIVLDVPIAINLQEVAAYQADSTVLEQLFTELEFYTLLRRLNKFLEEDPFASEYFTGEGSVYLSVPEQSETERMSAEQLPLLD